MCASLAFAIGVLAGFQGIFEKYKKDSVGSALTVPGVFYLLTRGIFPVIFFVFLYSRHWFQNAIWLQAIVLGLASEAVLRSKFYIKRSSRGDLDPTGDVLWGAFDLLRSYQNYFLEEIDGSRAGQRLRIVVNALNTVRENNLNRNVSFVELCSIIEKNSGAFHDVRQAILSEVNKQRKAYNAEFSKTAVAAEKERLDNLYKRSLGFALLSVAGTSSLKTLFDNRSQ